MFNTLCFVAVNEAIVSIKVSNNKKRHKIQEYNRDIPIIKKQCHNQFSMIHC